MPYRDETIFGVADFRCRSFGKAVHFCILVRPTCILHCVCARGYRYFSPPGPSSQPRALHVSRGTSRAQPRPRVAPPRLAPYRRLDAVHVRQPHHRHHPRPLRTQERAGHVRVALGDEGVVQRWHLGGAGRYLGDARRMARSTRRGNYSSRCRGA